MKNHLGSQFATVSHQKIFLLRHGEIENLSAEKRFIGQTDLPLNGNGRQQAQWWGQTLAPVRLTRILSSDLTRCADTAQIVAAEQTARVELLPGLREINLGEWEGMAFGDVKKRWPEAFRKRGRDLAAYQPPGG